MPCCSSFGAITLRKLQTSEAVVNRVEAGGDEVALGPLTLQGNGIEGGEETARHGHGAGLPHGRRHRHKHMRRRADRLATRRHVYSVSKKRQR